MIESYGNVQAILRELQLALKRLRETGETHTIYIEKTGLTMEEQVEVMETLGVVTLPLILRKPISR